MEFEYLKIEIVPIFLRYLQVKNTHKTRLQFHHAD